MILTEEMQQAVQSQAVMPRWLVWVSGRNLQTGLIESAGFWTGEYPLTVEIDGQTREYTGAGAIIQMQDPTYESGTTVQMQRITFALPSPEIRELVYQYDSRLAPAEIRLALFSVDTGELIGTTPAFEGWVEEPRVRETRDTATLTLTMATSSRAGTKTLATKKSPESLKRRNPNDKGRDYADLAGEIPVKWGGEVEGGYFI